MLFLLHLLTSLQLIVFTATENDQIVHIVFQYLSMLKIQPQKQNYDEIKAIKDIKFHFRDKVEPITYVKNLCGNLHVSLERCVLGRAFPEFNGEDITYILDRLTPESLNIQVVSPVFKTGVHNFIIDPIYGIQYAIESLSTSNIATWSAREGNVKFVLPGTNQFIPSNFTLKPMKDNTDSSVGSEVPQTVLNTDTVRVWHLQDTKYRIPMAFYGVFFKSNMIHTSPLAINQMTLFIKLYFDHINQLYYSGRLVSYSYNIVANKFGLELTVHGFNDKLDSYTLALLKELSNFKINHERFEILRDVQQNQLKTFSTSTLRNMLVFYLEMLVTPNSWSYDELLSSYGEMDIDGITRLVAHVLSHCQIEIFTHGNVTKEESIAFSQKVEQIFIPSPSKALYPISPFVLFDNNRDIQLPTDVLYEFTVTNDDQENHGILLYYQIGQEDMSLRSRLELFNQLIYSPYFNQIRTVEQLAYVTALSFKYTYSGTLGLYIVVQSAYAISYVTSRVEAFIDSVGNILTNMTKEQFERNKNSLITRLVEIPKRMFWQSNRLWAEITTAQFLFDRYQMLADKTKSIDDMEEMLHFYKEHFQSNGSKCRRMVVAIKSSKCKELPAKNEVSEGSVAASQSCAAPEQQQQQQKNQENQAASSAQLSADVKQTQQAESQSTAVQSQAADSTNSANKPPESLQSSIMVTVSTNNTTADNSDSTATKTHSALQTKADQQPNTAPTAVQEDSSAAAQPLAPSASSSSKRIAIAIGNVRKFKCENTHWSIPKIITDNFT